MKCVELAGTPDDLGQELAAIMFDFYGPLISAQAQRAEHQKLFDDLLRFSNVAFSFRLMMRRSKVE